jgi:F0F1-type ATP synthase assembly protein I
MWGGVRVRLPARWSPGQYHDALGQALTFVLAPVAFGALGWLLDSLLGSGPVFMILFGLFGAGAVFAWAWYRYEEQSARHEEGKPWTRRAR